MDFCLLLGTVLKIEERISSLTGVLSVVGCTKNTLNASQLWPRQNASENFQAYFQLWKQISYHFMGNIIDFHKRLE
jgi:hypothetical protein